MGIFTAGRLKISQIITTVIDPFGQVITITEVIVVIHGVYGISRINLDGNAPAAVYEIVVDNIIITARVNIKTDRSAITGSHVDAVVVKILIITGI